jgi:molecular chaperone GrpE (heat shock protein)
MAAPASRRAAVSAGSIDSSVSASVGASVGASAGVDYSAQLRQLMAAANLTSFRALAVKAGVSLWAINQVRAGRIAALRLGIVGQLSQALGLEVADLVAQFSPAGAPRSSQAAQLVALQAEYSRLQAQLAAQRSQMHAEFQAAALVTLEGWLLQWPTAAYAAQQNPTAPAVRLVPLAQPVEQLLQSWDVRAIAPVGSTVPYDPTLHQLMGGTAQPGDRVRVRYSGYWHGDRLLHRARVSPAAPTDTPA